EYAMVYVAAGRRLVREAHDGLPGRADQGLQYAIEDGDAELDALPERHLPGEMDLEAHHGLILDLVEMQHDRLVVQEYVLGQRLERMTHGRFLAQQQADRSQDGNATRLAHVQPERLELRLLRGQFEQPAEGRRGDAHLGVVQRTAIDAYFQKQ